MRLRMATYNDANTLFGWRNDYNTRRQCGNRAHVSWQEHMDYLHAHLGEIYMAEHGRALVGMIRDNDGELSYTIAPKHRRKGLGTMMVTEYIRSHQGRDYRVRVYSGNVASLKIADKLGLSCSEQTR